MQIEGQQGVPGTSPTLPASAIADHELLRLIGRGAYGEVWLARNALGAQRAVKIVHRHSFEHDRPFEREFNGIQKFEPISRSHEGFVDLLQVGRNDADGYFYYVMELADNAEAAVATSRAASSLSRLGETAGRPKNEEKNGEQVAQPTVDPAAYTPHTLKQELKRRGRLPLEECIQVGLSLTDALAYLHGQGLVHRDIKPSNIIFVGGVPKLADVGLVAGVGEACSYVGTEGFIPPEGPGTPQADLYSLGVVLYQLSTGKSHQEFPEPLSDLDAQPDHARWLEFSAIIHKACAAAPRERYRSAQEMQHELAILQGGQSVRHKRAVQRRWVAVKRLALVVCAAALAYLALPFLRPARHGHIPRPEVLNRYKLGQWYYYQCTMKDHAKAFKYLTQVTQMDPKFAQPYGELILLYGWGDVPEVSTDRQRLEAAREIVNKLKAIDPNLAQTHVALSFCHFLERDWRGAEREIAAAIKVDPNLALAHFTYCFYLGLEGKTAEAEREGKQAQALDPPEAARVSAIAAAWPFMAERRFDLAIAQLKQALELDENSGFGHLYLGNCYEAQSNYVAAIEEYRTEALHSNQNNQDKVRVNEIFDAVRRAYDTGGQQGYLQKWIELIRANATLPKDQQSEAFFDRDIAGYYARLGKKEKALDELEEHFDEPNAWSNIKFLPMYDSLHDEPRFKTLVKRAGLEP